MGKKIALLLTLIVAAFVMGYTVTGSVRAPALAEPETHVSRPAETVSPALARYIGAWEGVWEGVLSSRIVIEEVHPHWAGLVYTWGDHPSGTFKGGSARVRAKVLDGKLHWPFPGNFTFELSEDGTSLVGFIKQPTDTAMIIMKRAEPMALARMATPAQ
ncbi:MAG TPA: hypothetical protein VMG58_11240 [Candidatus Sulfotelmatobacter sp.]|nr:hypothetical protein [Candidatus Sulfotelmatobacter sp.]